MKVYLHHFRFPLPSPSPASPEVSVSSLDAHISHSVGDRFSEHLVMSPKIVVDFGVGEYEWHGSVFEA
jgi:hypothetical protein